MLRLPAVTYVSVHYTSIVTLVSATSSCLDRLRPALKGGFLPDACSVMLLSLTSVTRGTLGDMDDNDEDGDAPSPRSSLTVSTAAWIRARTDHVTHCRVPAD